MLRHVPFRIGLLTTGAWLLMAGALSSAAFA